MNIRNEETKKILVIEMDCILSNVFMAIENDFNTGRSYKENRRREYLRE